MIVQTLMVCLIIGIVANMKVQPEALQSSHRKRKLTFAAAKDQKRRRLKHENNTNGHKVIGEFHVH